MDERAGAGSVTTAWNCLVIALCVWAAVVGTLIGRDLWRWWFRRGDE